MSDLPQFLQMFMRLFAAIALSLWLHAMSTKPKEEEKSKPAPTRIERKAPPAAPKKDKDANLEATPQANAAPCQPQTTKAPV